MDGWSDGRMDGWTDGRTDGRTDRRTDGRTDDNLIRVGLGNLQFLQVNSYTRIKIEFS